MTEVVSSRGDQGENDSETQRLSMATFMDKYMNYIKVAIAGTGLVGIYLVSRSIRLTRRFQSVGDVPEEFFVKNFKLFGSIRGAAPIPRTDSADMVDVEFYVNHVPILNFSRVGFRKQGIKQQPLSIRIPCVKLHRRYFDTVKLRSVSKNAAFILLDKREDQESQHILAQVNIKEKGRFFWRNVDLGHLIISNGFGSVTHIEHNPSSLSHSHLFEKYYSKLLESEDFAASAKRGIWGEQDSRSRESALFRSIARIGRQFFSFLRRTFIKKEK